MFTYKNISIFSKIFLLVAVSLYFADYIFNGALSNIFMLDFARIVDAHEYWRLISYPFAYSGFQDFLLFVFTFIFIAPKLENTIDRKRYPLWLFLLVILQGLIFSMFFMGETVRFAGMAGVSIHLLLLYSLIEPRERIEFGVMQLRAPLFSASLFVLWAALKYAEGVTHNNALLVSSFSFLSFGVLSGVLAFLQIRITSIFIRKSLRRKDTELKIPKPEELSVAFMSGMKHKKLYQSGEDDDLLDDEISLLSDDPFENEEKLNEILDKINLYGKESLSTNDKRFLTEYSKQLKS